ncbi:MAG: tetratricopeptide repeat-containing sensor histidine kinase, partial [Saprospiraceae bacterium]|nr:tetratricopeptide repeat-containing sensor histidine kinase [Saprospiraceae bacterium]
MKKIFPLFLMLFIFQQFCISQDPHLVDSLETQLKNHNTTKTKLQIQSPSLYDTTAVNILAKLSQSYWGNDAGKAMDYAEQTLALSEQIGYKKGKGSAYNSMGVINHIKGDYIQAFDFFKKTLLINQEIGNKKGIANSYMNIGNTYMYLGNYPEALKNFITALKIKEEIGDKQGIAGSYVNIGIIYKHQANYPEALKNFFGSLKIFQEIGDQKGISGGYNNIGVIYYDQGNYPEALKNYFASLKIYEAIGDKHGSAVTYNNIGGVYYKQGNYPEALKYQFSALKLAEEIGANRDIASANNDIGNVYIKQKKYNDAAQHLTKSLVLSREISNLEGIKSGYKSLTALDSTQQNFKQALEHYKLYITYRDSLVNEENTVKITQQQMQYAFDIKETELKFQHQLTDEQLAKQQFINKQRLQLYLLGLIAFLGIIGLLITRLWYARKKQQLLQRQKEFEQHESERLLELDKLKTSLYTNITHEFRTPLTLILGPVRKMLVKPEKVSTGELVNNLKLVQDNGQRLLSLVTQILDLQKLEARQLQPQYMQGDIMALLHYLVDSFNSLVESKNITLDIECAPDSLMMDFDRDMFQKIFSNLLANAIKFTPDGGAIHVIAVASDGWLELAVSDSGIGIPKEKLDTIFS